MADPQQKLLSTLVTDQPTRNNFDVVNKNFTNIFGQLNANNYSVGEQCTSFTTSSSYPTLVNPTNLQVSITASGNRPILVFLRQKSDAVSSTVYSAGGFFLTNANGGGVSAVFYITRGTTPIFGTVLGGNITGFTVSGTPTYTTYCAPSTIMAFDIDAPPGVQTYFLQAAIYNTTGTPSITFSSVELVAKELF